MKMNVFIAKQTSAVHDRDLSQRVNEYTASDSSCSYKNRHMQTCGPNKMGTHYCMCQTMESDSVQHHIDKRFAHSAADELNTLFVQSQRAQEWNQLNGISCSTI